MLLQVAKWHALGVPIVGNKNLLPLFSRIVISHLGEWDKRCGWRHTRSFVVGNELPIEAILFSLIFYYIFIRVIFDNISGMHINDGRSHLFYLLIVISSFSYCALRIFSRLSTYSFILLKSGLAYAKFKRPLFLLAMFVPLKINKTVIPVERRLVWSISYEIKSPLVYVKWFLHFEFGWYNNNNNIVPIVVSVKEPRLDQ